MAEHAGSRFRAVARTVGGLALLLAGGVHYQQYRWAFYSTIPTIGPLFLANFSVATVLGLLLIAPVRAEGGHLRELIDQAGALAGVGLAATTLIGLLISEHTPIFGFQEHGYRFAVVLALASETVAIAALIVFLWQAPSEAAAQSNKTRSSPTC